MRTYCGASVRIFHVLRTTLTTAYNWFTYVHRRWTPAAGRQAGAVLNMKTSAMTNANWFSHCTGTTMHSRAATCLLRECVRACACPLLLPRHDAAANGGCVSCMLCACARVCACVCEMESDCNRRSYCAILSVRWFSKLCVVRARASNSWRTPRAFHACPPPPYAHGTARTHPDQN